MDYKKEIIYFFTPNIKTEGDKACLSNWFNSIFTTDGLEFLHIEQYIIYKKAQLFKDEFIAHQVMITRRADLCKKLGRRIRNYNDSLWKENRIHIIFDGCYLKFSQNIQLKKYLISTGNKHLVEASPYDNNLGIGLDEFNAKKVDPSKWPGQNLLGKILMDVRRVLIQDDELLKKK